MNINFVYVLYNRNNPDTEGAYSNDLFDLFGSPDGHSKGFVYSIRKSNHKKLRWDWGISGFKNIAAALYYDRFKTLDQFETFYKRFLRNKSNLSDRIVFPIKAVYQVKPKNSNAILFPAFIMDIHKFEKDGNRIWLTFTPSAYFVVDPDAWKKFLKSRDDTNNWADFCSNHNILSAILRAPSQSQHRIYPYPPFKKLIRLKDTNTLFFKRLDFSDRRYKERDVKDNQIFWGLYQYFTKQTQVIGDARFKYKSKLYEISSIPVNSLSRANAVFKHEIGSLQAIYSALSTCFGRKALKIDFTDSESILIGKSKLINRAHQVKNFNIYDQKYKNTDYDYVVDLRPLDFNISICVDLTVGLWNKSRNQEITDYLEQWKHNLIQMPKHNPNLITVFSFGVPSNPKHFFKAQSKYEGLSEFLNELAGGAPYSIVNKRTNSLNPEQRIIFVPFFGTTFNQELKNLIESPRDSLLYKAFTCIFRMLIYNLS